MYNASIKYKDPKTGKKFITFCQLPGDEHDEYFAKQVCFASDFEYISSQAEPNGRCRRNKNEASEGFIRKDTEFLNKGR
jgi:hypothetical protein